MSRCPFSRVQWSLMLLFVVGALGAEPAESARALVERAIKAQGGQGRLEKVKKDRITLKGTMQVNEKQGTFTGETTVSLPEQFRNVTELTLDGKKITLVQILNGDKGQVTVDGQPQKVTASALAEMRDIMHLDRATRLTPLLADSNFELTALGESKFKDKPVFGLKVGTKGQVDVLMYFDKESGLLVKTEHVLEESGKKVTQEEWYSDYKDFDGIKRPTRLLVYRQGKKLLEAEVIDAKNLDKVDETLFTKP